VGISSSSNSTPSESSARAWERVWRP
jgi:hypothetical protein